MSVEQTSEPRAVADLERHLADSDFLSMLRCSAQIASQVRSAEPAASLDELAAFARTGTIPALLALEAGARIPGDRATAAIVDGLVHSDALVRRHASWRLLGRPANRRAIAPLVARIGLGGIDTMHAHRALRSWAPTEGPEIVRHAAAMLAAASDRDVRSRLVDLVGVVCEPAADDLLVRVAIDPNEETPARIAAVGALGGRGGHRFAVVLRRLAMSDDLVGAHAALALDELLASAASGMPRRRSVGLRIVQLTTSGRLDGQLSLGGRGDTGGVASLLVSLGESLARRADVDHVLTVGRGSVSDALTGPDEPGQPSLSYGTIVIGENSLPDDDPSATWEHLPAIERGLRRLLRTPDNVDMLHLRMADAGTLAGAEIATALGVPICFSVAPDAHNVLHSLQSRGELDGRAFVDLDATSHVWFRARLIEHLARRADRLALFPRHQADGRPTVFELRDLESGAETMVGQRRAVVPEGIDIGQIRSAERAVDASQPGHAVAPILADLADLIPAGRRHLPLLLSVGRLHPVKGMERVVAAWAGDAALRSACNLVIVGGDLGRPSPTERAVLEAIERIVPADDPRRGGLVLLGGRPRADVAALLVAARVGHDGGWSGGGVYVDGALKEEFGLAVLEALAAGLVVVAPSTGGPATYVVDGDSGVLVDPGADLAVAVRAAFTLVDRPGRAARARAMVEDRYSIDTMADALVQLYLPAPVLV